MAASTAITSSALTVATPTDRDIVMTRVFDTPRRLVFEAWTRPAHLPHWWGPHGFTLPVCDGAAQTLDRLAAYPGEIS